MIKDDDGNSDNDGNDDNGDTMICKSSDVASTPRPTQRRGRAAFFSRRRKLRVQRQPPLSPPLRWYNLCNYYQASVDSYGYDHASVVFVGGSGRFSGSPKSWNKFQNSSFHIKLKFCNIWVPQQCLAMFENRRGAARAAYVHNHMWGVWLILTREVAI